MEPSRGDREATSVGPGAGRTRHFLGLLGICVAVPLAFGGCTDTATKGDPSDPPTATAPEEAETTPAEPTPADEAKAALEAYLEFRDEAYRRGEVGAKQVMRVAGGRELNRVVADVGGFADAHYRFSGTWAYDFLEAEEGVFGEVPTVTIIVCEDRAGVLVESADGEPRELMGEEGPLPDRMLFWYEVRRPADRWLVWDSQPQLDESNGLQTC